MHTFNIVNKSVLLKLSMNCSSGKIGPHLADWFQDKMTGIPKGGASRVSRPSGNGLARAHFLWNVCYADLMATSIFRGALSLLMAHFSFSKKQNSRVSECPEKIISSCPFELTFLIQASVHCPREHSVMVTFAGRLRNPRKGLQGSRALPPHTTSSQVADAALLGAGPGGHSAPSASPGGRMGQCSWGGGLPGQRPPGTALASGPQVVLPAAGLTGNAA